MRFHLRHYSMLLVPLDFSPPSKMLFASIAVLAAASVVTAQVKVDVGATSASPGGIFQFNPNSIKAAKGTVVTFEFTGAPGNHTVTQSSFDKPCEPLANGFDSGWIFIKEKIDPPPTWSITITDDSKPIWFYCKQLNPTAHCMVGAINVQPGDKSLQAFQNNAKAASAPGQAAGGLVGVGASASAPPTVPSGAQFF
ncbi:hypothetical protein C8J57DRAFT_1592218, partial [Mycena rebaudengoi]